MKYIFIFLCSSFLLWSASQKDAIKTHVKTLKTGELKARLKARKALIAIGEPVVPFMQRMLKSENPNFVHEAKKVLKALGKDGPGGTSKDKYDELVKALEEIKSSHDPALNELAKKAKTHLNEFRYIVTTETEKHSLFAFIVLYKADDEANLPILVEGFNNKWIQDHAKLILSAEKEPLLLYGLIKSWQRQGDEAPDALKYCIKEILKPEIKPENAKEALTWWQKQYGETHSAKAKKLFP